MRTIRLAAAVSSGRWLCCLGKKTRWPSGVRPSRPVCPWCSRCCPGGCRSPRFTNCRHRPDWTTGAQAAWGSAARGDVFEVLPDLIEHECAEAGGITALAAVTVPAKFFEQLCRVDWRKWAVGVPQVGDELLDDATDGLGGGDTGATHSCHGSAVGAGGEGSAGNAARVGDDGKIRPGTRVSWSLRSVVGRNDVLCSCLHRLRSVVCCLHCRYRTALRDGSQAHCRARHSFRCRHRGRRRFDDRVWIGDRVDNRHSAYRRAARKAQRRLRWPIGSKS